MHKKQYSFASLGLGAVGAALLLNGCGGSTFSKNTYGTYQNAVPAAYGIEATAANGNISGPLNGPFFYETSGLGSVDGKTAYLAAALDFTIVKNPNNATLLSGTDPYATGKVPLGFSGMTGASGLGATVGTGGQYIDANTAATSAIPSAVTPGTSVVFRAAISNGIDSGSRSTVPITYNGVTLSSTDPQWTLGSLPMTFNYLSTGPFANATYVTGTPVSSGQGTPTPFVLPFTTTGVHTLVLTVSDDAGQQTATTFAIPVVKPSDVALLIQNVDTGTQDSTDPKHPKEVFQAVSAGDTVIVDGGAGIGAYPTGFTPTIADSQGTVIFFVTPGTHTIVDTNVVPATAKAAAVTTVTTETITIPASAAGTTIIDPAIAAPTAIAGAVKARSVRRH
jgi:hypothetical protein